MEGARPDQDLSRTAAAVRDRRGGDRGDRGRRQAPRRRGDREMQGRAASAARTPHHRRLCRRRLRMAELTYRDAVARGIAQEMSRDPDVIFFGEDVAKAGGVFKTTVGLYEQFGPTGEVPEGEIVDRLGSASIVRAGKDATILALALMVPRALEAAEKLKAEHGIDCEVVDVRSLVPLDTQAILGSVARTHRLFTVEENPRLCGWGAE